MGTVCPARFWSLAKIVNVTLLLYQSYVQRLKLYNPDFIYKMATDGGGGAVFSRDGDDCKPYWSRVEIPTWMQFFSQSFVQIHTNKFIQLLYKLYSTNSYTVWFLYQFIHFYTNCIVQIHTSRERAAQPRASSASREGRSPSTPPAPTRPHPAAPTFRVHLAAPTS